MPLALVSPVLVGVVQLAVTRSLSFFPVADVVVPVRVDEPPEAIVNIVLELALVNDVVDLLSNSSHLAVLTELSQDVLVVFALSEGSGLVDGLLRVSHDILEFERSQLVPFLLSGLQSNSVRLLRSGITEWVGLGSLMTDALGRGMVSGG